jgi:hypothetical protein
VRESPEIPAKDLTRRFCLSIFIDAVAEFEKSICHLLGCLQSCIVADAIEGDRPDLARCYLAHRCEGEFTASGSNCLHRHAQFVSGDESCNVFALLEHRLVEANRSAPAVGAGVGAYELVDVSFGDRCWCHAHGWEDELSKELALAASEQHLGNMRSDKNADVPGAPVCDVGQPLRAEPGQARLDRGKAEHVLRVGGREAEDGRSTDVLACEMSWTNAEFFDEKVQVFGRGLAVVRPRPVIRVTETTQVDSEDTPTRRSCRATTPQ